MNDLLETSVYKEFVSPSLCRHLERAGIVPQLPFFWKVYETAHLKTYCFDADDYYKDGDKLSDHVCPPKHFIRAFTFGDMNSILPNYFFTKDNNGKEQVYEISLMKTYSMPAKTNRRLPDAAAEMVLECVRARIIEPGKATDKISSFLIAGK